MIDLTITRTEFDDRTEGKMDLPDGSVLYCIERPDFGKNPCIPEGIYEFERDLHGKHQWWKINGVEGRTAIEIHPANYAHQLLGCIAPCMYIEGGMGRNSVAACKILMKHFGEVGKKYTLEIKS